MLVASLRASWSLFVWSLLAAVRSVPFPSPPLLSIVVVGEKDRAKEGRYSRPDQIIQYYSQRTIEDTDTTKSQTSTRPRIVVIDAIAHRSTSSIKVSM
jgi:hypothetical protein